MLYAHLPLMTFVFAFGAAVGSFINVVIYRLPAGMSVTTPPSRCPTCGARLRFFRENLPILGWFLVRGKCRYCGVPISPQYMVIELVMALAFLGLYCLFYVVPQDVTWIGGIGSEWWHGTGRFISDPGFFRTWPVFIAIVFMVAALIAMTVIDARTFTIPIEIPLFITVTAFIAYTIQGFLPLHSRQPLLWPIPAGDWRVFAVGLGGMAGVLIGVAMLRLGMLRYSFADYHQYVEKDQVLGDYPHARREMLVEILFLLPCLIGVAAGWFVGGFLPSGAPPVVVQSLGGSMAGYLVGGGMIWGIRILGTFAFGREAMGLGDVHLLAAVGAVLGMVDPILVFFIAPFSGLVWHVGATGFAAMLKRSRRELPYGPHLAVGTLIVLLGRPGVEWVQSMYLPWLPLPGLLP